MKIFLGYASERLEEAQEVYDFLKTLSDDVWFDKASLVGGDDWDRERADAQQKADFVVHLISSDVFSRPGVVNREIRQTLKLVDDQPIGATYAVFVRLDDLRMPVELIRFQYIDYFQKSWRKQLSLAVEKRLGQLGGAALRITPEQTTMVKEDNRNNGGAARATRVESSVSTEVFQVTANYLQFTGSNAYWDFVNAKLAAEALGGFVRMAADFKRMDQPDRDRAVMYGSPHLWGINMHEFFRCEEFLSIRSSEYWYTGGAHPNHAVTTLNFLGSDFGLCSINDLLGDDEERAFRILDFCRKVLLAMYDGKGEQDYIAHSFEDKKHTWELAAQFSFDEKGLMFNFSPYQVLPYSFGSQEVQVPWRFVEPLLDKKYEGLRDKLS